MTRAKETVTLCEAAVHSNPFSPQLPDTPYLVRSALARDLEIQPELHWCYRTLGMRDVDLGFAGRQAAGSATHAALDAIAAGRALVVESVRPGARLLTQQGVAVGRLSSSCACPQGGSSVRPSAAWFGAPVSRRRWSTEAACVVRDGGS